MLSYLFLLELLTEKADDDNCQKNKIWFVVPGDEM